MGFQSNVSVNIKRVAAAIALAAVVLAAVGASAVYLTSGSITDEGESAAGGVEAAPDLKLAATQVELGHLLFYDGRLSGDGSTSCATCHDPNNAYMDGEPLSAGYSRGNPYFRNTPTLLNASKMPFYDWDGRFAQGDLATVVRDHIAEAHFMSLDGRLLVERMRQVPEYEESFKGVFGSEVSYGKVLNAVAAYLQTLESSDDNPYLAYKSGDTDALSTQARRGLDLFEGKAGCVQCHSGDLLSDGQFHNLGVPDNSLIFEDPQRHITFRRFFRMFGVSEFVTMRDDPGLYALTTDEADRGKFRTPSLLEVARTAPYMHGGVFESLSEVVEFYNAGGGTSDNKDAALSPLGLTDAEAADLVSFLESLSSPAEVVNIPELPMYELRTLGAN
ncbi:MAG: c-type cytochrome [Dehalococcoidia bacterium]|nr:c-type cytochrome [Dehalococcoidia bacterium]